MCGMTPAVQHSGLFARVSFFLLSVAAVQNTTAIPRGLCEGGKQQAVVLKERGEMELRSHGLVQSEAEHRAKVRPTKT